MKLLDKIIYFAEYMPDGYTKNLTEIHRNNPAGYYHYLVQGIKLAQTPKEAGRARAVYICGCWKIRRRVELDRKSFCLSLPKAALLYAKLLLMDRMTKSKFLAELCRRIFGYG